MTSKTAAKPAKGKRRRTTMVPVTTMEEMPILSGKERAELIARLKAAQARVKAGKAIDYDPETFKQQTQPESAARQETLDRVHRWYEQTKNPLYVWEAITRCLHADEQLVLPDWCVDYLRGAATNLYRLSCGLDFRDPPGPATKTISSDHALKLVSNALSLSKQGKRNAFASLLAHRDDMRLVVRHWPYRSWDGLVPEIQKQRNVTRESARRRATRGKRLMGVKGKTSA
jgi:hypothetical protein